jgi:peroxiredoxin
MTERRKCPECGVTVKVENLAAHYEKQHPRAKVPAKLLAASAEAARVSKKEHRPKSTVMITPGGKRFIAIVAIILALVLVIIIVNPFRPPGPQVGDTAPGFTVPNADNPGAVITLSSYRGFITVLELMDVDCHVCQQEAPAFVTAYDAYSPRGVKFLSVSLIDWVAPADTAQTIAAFKTQYGTSWTYAMDNTNRDVRTQYFPGNAGFGTPTTYILDRNGKITAIFRGHASGGASDYENALKALTG